MRRMAAKRKEPLVLSADRDADAVEAYVGLGANLGEREAALREAVERLRAADGVEVRRLSPVYETDPVGYTEQPAFLNMVAAIGTTLPPVALLDRLLDIERRMGRVRTIRWGPRTIDLDLLLYGEVRMKTERLTLPHPRMGERAFVLVPLRDVWPADRAFPWQDAVARIDAARNGIRRWSGAEMFHSPE